MNAFWENELVEIAAYYSVAVLCLVIFLTVFELVTSYKTGWKSKKAILRWQWRPEGKFSVSQMSFSTASPSIIRFCK